MKYIKIMSMIAFIGIYMAGCSQEQPKKKLNLLYKRKQRYQRRRTGRKTARTRINEELQAIQTNEQVEHKQEEVSSEEKKEETTPVQPTEQPVQNNEQKVEGNEKQEKFLVVIDPGHQQKRI